MKTKFNQNQNLKKITITLFIFGWLLLGFAFISNGQITPNEAIAAMQKGINIGNTMEPPYEAGWNNPKVQEYYFDMYREAGFTCVRIPVRWDNYTGKTPPYEINEAWLDRVEQVVDWGLQRDLFIIINAHHDNWIKDDYSDANKARFDSIWTQISTRFKNKTDKLIFEVLNEPHGLTKAQNDDMHQRILSIIRKTNPTRLVIFQGNEWGGSEELIAAAIPDDEYIIGSFHSYDPYLFGLQGKGTWGTSYDYTVLNNKFNAVHNWSETHNIPVLLGEFGALSTCDFNSRMRHYRAYVENAQKYGFAIIAWDDGGKFRILERSQHKWNEIKDILIHTNSKSPKPSVYVYQDSIIKVDWTNNITDNDSIIIQRRLKTAIQYQTIAVTTPDTNSYLDVKPPYDNTYVYRIIAAYNDSVQHYSQPYEVVFPKWERPVRIPFGGTPQVIPGIIEAEDFDKGGEGLSYHDTNNQNIAGDYRPDEAVDIYDRLGDGYHIGNALPGEWYEYSLNVTTTGKYDITFHLAALYGGGTFQITIDTIQSAILTAPTCYSWLNTLPVSTSLYLNQGNHILRFSVLSEPLFNIDKMAFDLKTALSDISVDTSPSFKAFQNSFGQLEIKMKKNETIKNLTVFSATGGIVALSANPSAVNTIPLPKLTPGIYFITAATETKTYTQKVFLK